jgi:hypothetical protein
VKINAVISADEDFMDPHLRDKQELRMDKVVNSIVV